MPERSLARGQAPARGPGREGPAAIGSSERDARAARARGSRRTAGRAVPALACLMLAALIPGGRASAGERIVGGSPIQIQSAPWSVFVSDQTPAGPFVCSGSIVDAAHVLTAAHCVHDGSGALAQASQLTVEAGVSNSAAPLATDLEQRRTVSSFTVHPGYVWSEQVQPDDVAVLTLAGPLDLSGPAAKAVALPAPNSPFPAGAAVAVAGFGVEAPGAQENGSLEWMTATVDAQGSCGGVIASGVIAADAVTLCASSPTAATCNGDSGAGLVTTASPPTLVGVVSGGPTGCVVGTETVYTYLGAAEISAFVQGDEQPPTAPRQDSDTSVDLDWDRPLVVGATLTCSSADWANGPVSLRYAFVTGSGQVLQTGTRTTYTLRPSDLGATVTCAVAASNAGGTAVGITTPTPAVKPAPQLTIIGVSHGTAARGRDVTLSVALRAPRGLHGRFGVCVRPPARVGGPVCSSLADQLGDGSETDFDLSFWVKPTAPLGTSELTLRAFAGVASAQSTVPLKVNAASR
jgi:Trypsin